MNLIQFFAKLELATTQQQAEAILNDYLKGYGFQSYAFTYYSGHIKTGRKLRYDCVSVALQPWHQYYLEQGYADVDRTLEEANIESMPIFWDVHQQLTFSKNKREERIRLESIEYEIDKGLSLPVYGPEEDFVTLTLHQRQGENSLVDYQLHQFEWLSATQIYYHFIKKILNLTAVGVAPYQLTRREEQCLMLTAKSWRVEHIAKELKISPRTVNFHLQNANKKMGANNKYQAVNKYFRVVK